MTTTAFTNGVTQTDSAWFNDVDAATYPLTSVSGSNTIVASGPSGFSAYALGQVFKFVPAANNTGATTLNVSSAGAKNVYAGGVALVGGEIVQNVPAAVMYDGTQFQLLSTFYKSATYTATATPSTSGSITLNSSADTLTYTRAGRKVTVIGKLTVTSVSSPVGYIIINLPFAISDLTETAGSPAGSVLVNNTNAAAVNAFVCLGVEGESALRVYLGTGTSIAETAANEIKGTSEIYVNFTYFA